MARTGLQEFTDVLKTFNEMGALAVTGTIAIPLANLYAKLGPPPSIAISLLTSGMEFFAVMWTFHFWHGVAQKRLNGRMKVCAVIFCIALIASGVLLEQFTTRPVSELDRIVYGYSLRPDVQPLLNATYTPMDALRDAEYDPEKVWTSGSITTIHVVLVLCWLLTAVAMSIFVASFIILHRR